MSSPSIGIVGAGISGLHLALMLQRNDVTTTLYADQSATQMRAGRLLNNVCRFGRTRHREVTLGVNHWDLPDWYMRCAHVRVHIDPPIAFRGDLSSPASFVDFRLYLPRLIEDYAARGGNVVVDPALARDLATIAARHDLLVLATGGRLSGQVFPVQVHRSLGAPRRVLLAGLFHGVSQPEPVGLHFDIVPGAGEIFQSPVLSLEGRVSGITFEAVPDGPWGTAISRRYDDSPASCREQVLRLLDAAGSEILDRVNPAEFQLTRPLDLLQGSITPTVRRPWARLGDSGYAVAVGDAAVLNDPVTGQGANLAVASAWALGEALLVRKPLDEEFCRAWARQLWQLARDVTAWTNAVLDPPSGHVVELLAAAGQDQRVADAFLNNFDDPQAMWRSLESPQAAAGFIARASTGTGGAGSLHDLLVSHELRLLAAVRSRDEAAIGELVAPDAVIVGDGLREARALCGTPVLMTASGSMTDIRTFAVAPDVAIITFRLGRHGVSGPDDRGHGYYSSIWRRISGYWRVICRHESPGR